MITITIMGEPHPQGRPRCRKEGRFAKPYQHRKDADWKRDAAKQIIAQNDESRPVFRSGIPLRVEIIFEFSCPKTDHRKRKPKPMRWHVKKKDIDNLAKAILDAANGILWDDDGQIVILDCRKVIAAQGHEPRTTMRVSRAHYMNEEE